MRDDDFFPFFVLLLATAATCFFLGFNSVEHVTTRNTIKMCVEKPADCKTKYDYFKLEEQK